MSKLIGVFGGTFDPIHYGHLRPVLDVVETLDIEKCHFIPCNIPHHRASPLATSVQRLEMVAAAIKVEPRFYLDPVEINRDGISYTVDTLESLKTGIKSNDILCLIVGVDAFAKFDHWHRWQDILNLCHIIVTHRPGWDVELLSEELTNVISHRRIVASGELKNSQSGKILFQAVTQLDISATNIRESIKSNKSIQYLLPDKVITLIKNQNIYVK